MNASAPSASAMPPALVLAAGRGERMRPLTDSCPKPLLSVRGQPLLTWWLRALAQGGVPRAVINTAWLGEQIEAAFSQGAPLPLAFSSEGRDFGHALETAGGIVRALPLLATQPQDMFWALAGDIFAPGFRFDAPALRRLANSQTLAHLWLVPNPPQHPQGDFAISTDGLALNDAPPGGARHTFSAIGLYRRALFEPPWCDIPAGNPQGTAAPLAPLLRRAIAVGLVSAELYTGEWTDVGTPERLAALNAAAY